MLGSFGGGERFRSTKREKKRRLFHFSRLLILTASVEEVGLDMLSPARADGSKQPNIHGALLEKSFYTDHCLFIHTVWK